eukprot:2687105-Pleurochrysis_carterae.AAC.1
MGTCKHRCALPPCTLRAMAKPAAVHAFEAPAHLSQKGRERDWRTRHRLRGQASRQDDYRGNVR